MKPAINCQRLKLNLKKMIDIYSPSGKEVELLDYLTSYLKNFDFKLCRQKVSRKRYNIILKGKDLGSSNLLFIGHVDTVAAFSLKDYSFKETGKDMIFGLGSVDMKSGCAAMIESFIAFREATGNLPLADLALVVGEEDSGDGVSRLLQDYSYSWAVVGEPTNLKPCLNHYGYLECEFNTYGARRHASFGGKSHNAVYSMLNLLLELRNYFNFRSNYIYNIRDLHSSDAGFSVPDSCVCWVDIHVPAKVDLNFLKEEVSQVIDIFLKKQLKAKVSLSFPTLHEGYKISHQQKIVRNIKEAYLRNNLKWSPGRFCSDSDASILHAAGIKPVIIGPGRLAKAHTERESVNFSQVIKASEIYSSILSCS